MAMKDKLISYIKCVNLSAELCLCYVQSELNSARAMILDAETLVRTLLPSTGNLFIVNIFGLLLYN